MSVNVELEFQPFKKQTIKTSPAMSLSDIAATAAKSFKLDPSSCYALRHGKNLLDLSLSMRFANLPAGAKLILVKSPTKIAGNIDITICLQLEDGSRHIDKYKQDTKLWDILTHIESKMNVNITQRADIPSKGSSFIRIFTDIGKKMLYQVPACIITNKEYNTIEALQSTSLFDAGIFGGNSVIRVLFKFTDKTLQEMMPLLKATGVIANVMNHATIDSEKLVANPIIPSSDISNAIVDSAPIQSASHLHTKTENSTVYNNESPTTDASIVVHENTSPTSPSVELDDDSSNIQVFKPLPLNAVAPRVALPDSFFVLSSIELKNIAQSQKATMDKLASGAPLQTLKMREAEKAAKNAKYPKTLIRIRFPDQSIWQSTFFSHQPVVDLYERVKGCLREGLRALPFRLVYTPPFRGIDDHSRSFWAHCLAPASLLYIKWDDGCVDLGGGAFFSEEWVVKMVDHPILKDLVALQSEDSDMEAIERTTIPAANEAISSQTDQVSISNEASPADAVKKVPKWFKIGK